MSVSGSSSETYSHRIKINQQPVLAPNYKQHNLSPAKVRKIYYSLAEIYVKSLYLNLFGWRGR
jgi:hypothetical protein